MDDQHTPDEQAPDFPPAARPSDRTGAPAGPEAGQTPVGAEPTAPLVDLQAAWRADAAPAAAPGAGNAGDDGPGHPGADEVDGPHVGEPPRPTAATPWWVSGQTPPPPAGVRAPSRLHRAAVKVGSTGAAVVLAAAATGIVVHAVDDSRTVAAATTTTVPAAAPVASVQGALTKAEKSVVIINDTITTTTGTNGFGNGFGGGFGGQSAESSAAGTGIIISSAGEVVTNAHVVNGATDIKVTLPDGSVHPATIVGLNASKDLAVIKLSGVSGLTPATFANSSTASIGDAVLAIGNAEGYGGKPSVTEGILSATNRSLSSSEEGGSSENLSGLLQTDAAINPGNSGGPLVDTAGDVLGIDTAVAEGTTSEPAQNIGFVIPSNTVVAALPALESGQSVGQDGTSSSSASTTPVLGVEVADNSSGAGAVVEQVESGSGAATAGLQAGDVITALDGTSISDASALAQAIDSDSVGQVVQVTYTRGGTSHTARATLGS